MFWNFFIFIQAIIFYNFFISFFQHKCWFNFQTAFYKKAWNHLCRYFWSCYLFWIVGFSRVSIKIVFETQLIQ